MLNGIKDEILGLHENLEEFKSQDERNFVLHITANVEQSELISDILLLNLDNLMHLSFDEFLLIGLTLLLTKAQNIGLTLLLIYSKWFHV